MGAVLAGACKADDAAVTAKFDAANRLYETKDYANAKAAYDQMIKSGPLSANLYYNRGNAEWKLGDGGAAIADYERALALEPSHPQARVNLDFVRDQTAQKFPRRNGGSGDSIRWTLVRRPPCWRSADGSCCFAWRSPS